MTSTDLLNYYYDTSLITSSTVSSIQYGTVTTDNSYNYVYYNNYSYQPFENQYIYDPNFQWNYTDTLYGLREYLFANVSYRELAEYIRDTFEVKDEQEFEDNLYALVLDVLYEYIDKTLFSKFFNEEFYPYRELNAVIQDIIDTYHRLIKENIWD